MKIHHTRLHMLDVGSQTHTVRCKMFNPNIFYLPIMPAQIYGQLILPESRFTFIKMSTFATPYSA